MIGKLTILLVAVVAAVNAVNECPREQETDWNIELLLVHEDCDKFYKCTYGVPVEQVCPPDLYFNTEYWQCDWQENVDCGDRNVPGEVASQESKEVEPEVTEDPDDVITGEPDDYVTGEPEDIITVEPELQPEPEESESESEEITAAPEDPKLESEEDSAPEGETPEIEFLENGCPVNPHVHWLLPNKEDCNRFYYCVWGEKVPRVCPSSLHFNPVIQVCDWPWDAGCTTTASFNKYLPIRRTLISKRK
ncbi:insect intestinal mucin [Aphomia sociella]